LHDFFISANLDRRICICIAYREFLRKGGENMKKLAILASVWLVCTASLAFGAVAFADDDDDDHHGERNHRHCEYKRGKLVCDRD